MDSSVDLLLIFLVRLDELSHFLYLSFRIGKIKTDTAAVLQVAEIRFGKNRITCRTETKTSRRTGTQDVPGLWAEVQMIEQDGIGRA